MHSNFDEQFIKERQINKFNVSMMSFFVVMATLIIFVATMAMFLTSVNTIAKGNHSYIITIENGQTSSTFAADSIIYESDRCIEFRNTFGLIQRECGYRISRVQIK